jgi:histidine triad (HIT) family protein
VSDDCVFCELIRRGYMTPNDWSEAGSGYRVFAPLNPVTKGHLLVVPTEHVTDALDDPRVTAFTMGAAATVAKGPCNLITSVGSEATQTVRHLHIHIVPRRKHDGLQLPWSEWEAERAELVQDYSILEGLATEQHAELSALRAAQPLTREKLDEMIDTTLNDLGAKYGYHMEQRVIRNVALREFRDALLDSLSLPVSEQ